MVDERLDQVGRVLWALAAFVLIGALPFVMTLIAKNNATPFAQERSGGALGDILVLCLFAGVPAALVTYALASIPSKAARALLLTFAATGSAAVGFVLGFIGVFSVTSPTVGDH